MMAEIEGEECVRQHITAMCSSEWDRATLASGFGKLLSPGRGLAAGAPISQRDTEV